MRLYSTVLAVALAAAGAVGLAPAAQAHCDRNDGYRSDHWFRGRDGAEVRRRDITRERLQDLGMRVRLAAREGEISRGKADDLFDDLDDVRDFLRGDRYLTDSEFDRRMDDLDDVERDLRNASGYRYSRYGRRYRY